MIHKTCILIGLLLITVFAQWTYLPGSLNYGGPIITSHDTLLTSGGNVAQTIANDSTRMSYFPVGLSPIRGMLKFHDSIFVVGNKGIEWGDMTGCSALHTHQTYSIAIAVDTTIYSPTKYPVDTIFVGTDSGVYYSPSDTSSGWERLPRCKYWFPKNNGLVTKINALNYWYGVLEVGTDSGVFWYYNNKWIRDDYDFPTSFVGTTSKKINTMYSNITYSTNTGNTWFIGTDSGFYMLGDPTTYLAGKRVLSFCTHGTTLFVGTDSLVYRFPDPYDFSNYSSLPKPGWNLSYYRDSIVSIACNDNYLYVTDHWVDLTRPTRPQSPAVFYYPLYQTSIVLQTHKILKTFSQSRVQYFSLNGRKIIPKATGFYIKNTNITTTTKYYRRGSYER